MTALTDADLIAALGWQPCRSFGGSGPCDEHGSAQRLNPSGVCSYQAARLHLVRAGIELARNGIFSGEEAMTGDALERAAQAAWATNGPEHVGLLPYDELQPKRRNEVRAFAAAALRVMADDLRELHQHEQCLIHHAPGDLCGRHWCRTCQSSWPCETVAILDTYTGSSDA